MHEWHLFWPAANRCAVLLVDKPADYARRNTSPLAHGARQKPNTTASMWGGSRGRTLKKASFSERRTGSEAGCLVPGSACRSGSSRGCEWRTHPSSCSVGAGPKCHHSQQHMCGGSMFSTWERWATMAHLLLYLKLAARITLQKTIVTPCFQNIRDANQFKSFNLNIF